MFHYIIQWECEKERESKREKKARVSSNMTHKKNNLTAQQEINKNPIYFLI